LRVSSGHRDGLIVVRRFDSSNDAGVWNNVGAELHIHIVPAWYQTLWFRSVCAAVLAGLLWGSYRLRLRQLARAFERTLDARVAERTRIARDLHDTLLGSLNGVLLRLEAASILFQVRPAEAKQTLDSTIAQAAQAINESRDAVQGLRSLDAEPNDLAEAIDRLGKELCAAGARRAPAGGHQPIGFGVEVEGARRRMHSIVQDEVYRIATEALRNAFQHSHGTQIEVELHYDVRWFRLRIRDRGQGVDPQILAAGGRPGHFGLKGMRERAELVGGRLAVWSAWGTGTEVELTIPGTRAYAGSLERGQRGPADTSRGVD
jgi:signal transduction histidine kinase